MLMGLQFWEQQTNGCLMSQFVTNLSVEMTNCVLFLKWSMCKRLYMCLCMYTWAWNHMGNSEIKENYQGVKIFGMKNLFHANLWWRRKGKKSKTESEQKIKSETENSTVPPLLLRNICFIIGPVAIYSLYPPSVCNGVLVLRSYQWKKDVERAAEEGVVRKSGEATAAEESIFIN